VKTTPEEPHIVRCAISKEMAFPVGYELLRDHFGDLPQWPTTTFYFCAHPTTFASEFAAILRSGEPYRILRVEHLPHSHLRPGDPAHWHFTVYPVPRAFKSIARTALGSGPFASLHEFIRHVPAHPNYYNGTDVVFDPQSGACTTGHRL